MERSHHPPMLAIVTVASLQLACVAEQAHEVEGEVAVFERGTASAADAEDVVRIVALRGGGLRFESPSAALDVIPDGDGFVVSGAGCTAGVTRGEMADIAIEDAGSCARDLALVVDAVTLYAENHGVEIGDAGAVGLDARERSDALDSSAPICSSSVFTSSVLCGGAIAGILVGALAARVTRGSAVYSSSFFERAGFFALFFSGGALACTMAVRATYAQYITDYCDAPAPRLVVEVDAARGTGVVVVDDADRAVASDALVRVTATSSTAVQSINVRLRRVSDRRHLAEFVLPGVAGAAAYTVSTRARNTSPTVPDNHVDVSATSAFFIGSRAVRTAL